MYLGFGSEAGAGLTEENAFAVGVAVGNRRMLKMWVILCRRARWLAV